MQSKGDGSASFKGLVKVGETGVGEVGTLLAPGSTTVRVSGNTSQALVIKTKANNDVKAAIYGSGNIISGGPDVFTGTDKGSFITNEGNTGAVCGASSSAFRARTQGNSTPTVDILGSGSASFAGNITAANVTFNLEPENPDNYTTTEEEYEVEVPVLRPDGPVTADLVDGEPEQEMQTITRTREVTTYTGPTMDVKDTLLKITEALTQLKVAAASATTCEELRTAIDTALADV